jgi:DNA-binding LacI/PurR family transcriptional regulator
MKALRIRSAADQLADYLKEEILAGRWTERMPGESWLMERLELGRGTVRAAMARMEEEGVLESHGQGRWRRIVQSPESKARRTIRLRIFLYEKLDRGDIDNSSLLAQLMEAGINASFTEKSLKDLGMDADRVARHVHQNPADAWVLSAASREVLEWFASQPTPAMAMYGRSAKLPIAAAFSDMIPGQTEAVARLLKLGHKRIVMLTREERRKPELSRPEQVFLNQLEAAGIRTGAFNLPDWEESREGLRRCLDELFRHSPPTALFFQEATIYIAARAYLADRGIVAPRDVSLVVTDRHSSFAWSDPMPAHVEWDYRPLVRRVVRWAKNVAAGKDDQRQSGTGSKFIEGGTIGPVRGGG